MTRPTVHDIARAAGVSLATVDRVLNARPGVRGQTIDRVQRAIDELGYVRDVAAANLARQRRYNLVFVLPEGANAFVGTLAEAIAEAGLGGLVDRTALRAVQVPAHDPHALAAALRALEEAGVDGVAIMAPETPHVRDAIRRLRQRGIAVVALVSDLPNTERDHFVGIDNVAAGRTAGVLLGRFIGRDRARVLVLAGSMQARDNMERRLGFDEIMAAQFPWLEVLPSIEGRDDPGAVADLVTRALDAPGGVGGIYALGGGNRGLLHVLRARGVAPPRAIVVAHELTPLTRQALIEGSFDAVISQDAGHVVRSAIRLLRAFSDRRGIVASQERIRISITLRENLQQG